MKILRMIKFKGIFLILLILSFAICYKTYYPNYKGRKAADMQFEKGYVVLEGSRTGYEKEFGVPIIQDPYTILFGLSCWESKPADYDKMVSACNTQIVNRIKNGVIPKNSLKEFETVIINPSEIPADWIQQQFRLTEKLKQSQPYRLIWENGKIKAFCIGEELEPYKPIDLGVNNFDEYFTIAMPLNKKIIGIIIQTRIDNEKLSTIYSVFDTIGGIPLNHVIKELN